MKNPAIGPKLILASRSPRRRNLLDQAGIEFSVIPSSFDEKSVEHILLVLVMLNE